MGDSIGLKGSARVICLKYDAGEYYIEDAPNCTISINMSDSDIQNMALFIDKLLIEMDVMWEDQQSKFQMFFRDVLVKHLSAVPNMTFNDREIITLDFSPLIECGDVFIEQSTEKWLLKKYSLSKKEIKKTLQNSITKYADLKPIFKSEDESIPF